MASKQCALNAIVLDVVIYRNYKFVKIACQRRPEERHANQPECTYRRLSTDCKNHVLLRLSYYTITKAPHQRPRRPEALAEPSTVF